MNGVPFLNSVDNLTVPLVYLRWRSDQILDSCPQDNSPLIYQLHEIPRKSLERGQVTQLKIPIAPHRLPPEGVPHP
jgi:hypothetical protein